MTTGTAARGATGHSIVAKGTIGNKGRPDAKIGLSTVTDGIMTGTGMTTTAAAGTMPERKEATTATAEITTVANEDSNATTKTPDATGKAASTATGNLSKETEGTTGMMKKINLLLWLMCLPLSLMAQGKKSFTLDDLMPGGSTFSQMQPQSLYTEWWGDRCVETALDACHEIDADNGKKKTLFTLEQLNQWLEAPADSPLVRSCFYVSFPDAQKPLVAVTVSNRKQAGSPPTRTYAVIDFKKGEKVYAQTYPADAAALDRATATNNLAFVRKQDLYVIKGENGKGKTQK